MFIVAIKTILSEREGYEYKLKKYVKERIQL